MPNDVVITGIGTITPAGIGVSDFWKGMVSGRSFISPITKFDTSQFTSKVAGIVEDFDLLRSWIHALLFRQTAGLNLI